MVATHKIANFRRTIFNKLILLVLITVVLIVPVYLGIVASFVIQYGAAYAKAGLNPEYMLFQYYRLFYYWWYYRSQLPMDFTMKLIGPPGGGLLLTLIGLWAARAPLLDFRPFSMKESIHGD